MRLTNHPTSNTLYWCVLFGLAQLLLVQTAFADVACSSLFKARAFAKAGRCYKMLVSKVAKHPRWRKEKQLFQDRFLRKAAQSYARAAVHAKTPAARLYYQELTANMFLHSFTKGTCMAAGLCRVHRMRYDKIKRGIGYTSLDVLTGDTKAHIEVTGYKYKQHTTHTFHATLRPGRYTLVITGPRFRKQTREVTLAAGTPQTINVTPTTIIRKERRVLVPQKIPPLVISGYAFGAAMTIAGTIMVIFGVVERERINSILRDPNKARTLPAEEAQLAFQHAETVQTIGFVIGLSGLAFVLGAGIAHAALKRDKQPSRLQTPTPPAKGQVLLQY